MNERGINLQEYILIPLQSLDYWLRQSILLIANSPFNIITTKGLVTPILDFISQIGRLITSKSEIPIAVLCFGFHSAD